MMLILWIPWSPDKQQTKRNLQKRFEYGESDNGGENLKFREHFY